VKRNAPSSPPRVKLKELYGPICQAAVGLLAMALTSSTSILGH